MHIIVMTMEQAIVLPANKAPHPVVSVRVHWVWYHRADFSRRKGRHQRIMDIAGSVYMNPRKNPMWSAMRMLRIRLYFTCTWSYCLQNKTHHLTTLSIVNQLQLVVKAGMNSGPPDFKSGTLTTWPSCLVKRIFNLIGYRLKHSGLDKV